MESQRALLLKLKYKKLNKLIDYEVCQNFGYSPQSEYFDKLLRNRSDIYTELVEAGFKLSNDEKHWE